MRVETFSKRMKRLEKFGKADVYQYTTLPNPFRVQVFHIWRTAIGYSEGYWRVLNDSLARELGVFRLDESLSPFEECVNFLMKKETNNVLDIIELSFRLIDKVIRDMVEPARRHSGITQDPEDAILELNDRFKEHKIGYQFAGGQLVRIDSQYVHEEIVRPAISLLHDEGFQGASDEFLRAHEHYRKGRCAEAITEACKAFESTMKAICDARKWAYPNNATATPLIAILFKNGLLPSELESHFGALRSVMESGLPAIRNKPGGAHGQGAKTIEIPSYLVAYALHLAASNIVFMVEAHTSMK